MAEEIHCRMSDSELDRYGREVGEMLHDDIAAQRYDHACSDMIGMALVNTVADISCVCNCTFSELRKDVQRMTRWLNYAKLARCICVAAEMWLDAQADIVFDADFLRTGIEDYPRRIQEDLCVFCGWAIYRGADGASIRKGIPSSTQRSIRRIIKNRGDNGVLNRLWRALVAFRAMAEKAIAPEYAKALRELKHGLNDGTDFGTMAAAMAGLKKC